MPSQEPVASAARQIRGTHPYCFRAGEWADITGTVEHARGRLCYVVRFADGTSDFWPVEDLMAGYEFREAERNVR